jgi:hypothetical protein
MILLKRQLGHVCTLQYAIFKKTTCTRLYLLHNDIIKKENWNMSVPSSL